MNKVNIWLCRLVLNFVEIKSKKKKQQHNWEPQLNLYFDFLYFLFRFIGNRTSIDAHSIFIDQFTFDGVQWKQFFEIIKVFSNEDKKKQQQIFKFKGKNDRLGTTLIFSSFTNSFKITLSHDEQWSIWFMWHLKNQKVNEQLNKIKQNEKCVKLLEIFKKI